MLEPILLDLEKLFLQPDEGNSKNYNDQSIIFYHHVQKKRISFFPNKQSLSFTLFLVSDPFVYIRHQGETYDQLSKHFYKKE